MTHLEKKRSLKSTITMTDKVVRRITNITDLNMECLLNVFHYLSVTELANLDEANITSNWKYGKRKRKGEIRRYKQSIVKAFQIKVRVRVRVTVVYIDIDYAVEDIKMLRSFGREVEALLIGYTDANQNRRYEKALEDAVIKNCSKTLTSIYFNDFNKDSMNELEQPFINVEFVEFLDGHLGSTLGQLKKCFPKMVDLRFINTYIVDSKCIHEHFPLLESLTVWNGWRQEKMNDQMIFTNSNLKAFAHLNPQLEELDICHDDVDESESDNAIIVDWDLLTFINKNLKLKRLKLNLENFRFEREWQSMVNFKSLIALDVECVNGDCLDKIKITSDKRIELNLKLRRDTQFNYEAIATFVIRTEPKQLKIKVEGSTFAVDNEQVINMTQMLPKLQELVIHCLWNDDIPDAVINLLVNTNALKKLVGVFNFGRREAYPQMRQVFREKIVENCVVASKWTHNFDRIDDDLYFIDSVEFQKRE